MQILAAGLLAGAGVGAGAAGAGAGAGGGFACAFRSGAETQREDLRLTFEAGALRAFAEYEHNSAAF